MVDPDTFAQIKERISTLIDTFFQQETTAQERKQILAEIEQFPDHLAGALFGVIAHPYTFELAGKPYTLEYRTTYHLNTFKSEYQINLYRGHGEDRQLFRQETDTNIRKTYIRFLKLVDAVKNDNFDINKY